MLIISDKMAPQCSLHNVSLPQSFLHFLRCRFGEKGVCVDFPVKFTSPTADLLPFQFPAMTIIFKVKGTTLDFQYAEKTYII